MEKELAAAKKSFDTMVLKSKSKEYSINRLKNEIKKVEYESGVIKKEAKQAN